MTQWTAACQALLSLTVSQSLLKLMSTESVILSNHLILCLPLLLLPSIFPNIRVFSNELALCIRSQSIEVSISAQVFPMNTSLQPHLLPAHQAPLSMRFSRQEYLSGLPFSPPGYLPNLGTEPASPVSSVLAGRFFTTEPSGKPYLNSSLSLKILLPKEVTFTVTGDRTSRCLLGDTVQPQAAIYYLQKAHLKSIRNN